MAKSEDLLKRVEELIPEYYGPNYNNETVTFINGVAELYIQNPEKFIELFNNLVNTKTKLFKVWLLNTLIQLISKNISI